MSKPYVGFWPKQQEKNIRLVKNEAMLALERIIGNFEKGLDNWCTNAVGGELEELAEQVESVLVIASCNNPEIAVAQQQNLAKVIKEIQSLGNDPREGLVETKSGQEKTQ